MPESALLHWRSLTSAINEIKSPNRFLGRLLFSNHQALDTETIELGIHVKAREIAPFVRKNGEAIMVKGHSQKTQVVEAPNIRIKMPFTPSPLLFDKPAGATGYAQNGENRTAAFQHIARDLQVMADMATNTEEWLAAMALRGVVTYTATDREVFQITFGKPAANNVTLTTFWDDADPQAPTPEEDFHTAKQLISDAVGLGVTDAICGTTAAMWFRQLMKKQGLMDMLKLDAGSVTFTEQFRDDGVMFLGRFCGINVWEYGRSATLDGAATPMIRAKYVEFVANSPAAENVMYYAAIPDWDLLDTLLRAERFSKSWTQPDPSVRQYLLHTRPLAVMRRPGSCVSMKVVSGA